MSISWPGVDSGRRRRSQQDNSCCRAKVRPWGYLVLIWAAACSGCAALTNPVANGIPPRELRPELRAEPKDFNERIPLTWLRRKPLDHYRLDDGDILGVYIQGILGGRDQPPPVNFSQFANLPPSLGYPIPVREDGTLSLPIIDPVDVGGLTVPEAEDKIIKAYAAQQVLRAERERIVVTLIRPRHERILVVREDSPEDGLTVRTQGPLRLNGNLGGGSTTIGGERGGTGTVVDLPVGENDVLNALTQTGGLPGPQAANEVIIQRGYLGEVAESVPGPDGEMTLPDPQNLDGEIIRIPLQRLPGGTPSYRPEDVVLKTGDIVYVPAQPFDQFYAGGLLPAGAYPLPRDHDLSVVQAVMQIQGPIINGGVNSSNLSGAIIAGGFGNPSPKQVSVIRRLPDGRQFVIRVDLDLAIQDSRDNLLVQPGDILILQETKGQAITRYFKDQSFFSILSNVISRTDTTAATGFMLP